jgi:hypothetical protein
MPGALEIGREIEQYGMEAITGRKVMPVRLIRDANIATNIWTAYQERHSHRNKEGAVDWAEWTAAEENQAKAEMLKSAEKLYREWLKAEYG